MIKNTVILLEIFTCYAGSCTPEDKITMFLCTVTFDQAVLPIVRIVTGIGTLWAVVSFWTLCNINSH